MRSSKEARLPSRLGFRSDVPAVMCSLSGAGWETYILARVRCAARNICIVVSISQLSLEGQQVLLSISSPPHLALLQPRLRLHRQPRSSDFHGMNAFSIRDITPSVVSARSSPGPSVKILFKAQKRLKQQDLIPTQPVKILPLIILLIAVADALGLETPGYETARQSARLLGRACC